jgi:hypothetical protein
MASMAALQPAGINCLVVEPTPPKNDGVRWDDEIPYIVENYIKMFQTTNQTTNITLMLIIGTLSR